MIPAEQQDSVARGLRKAFGVSSFDQIQQLTRGRSPGALVFRIAIHGRAFLLRVITRADDPTRHFTCMEAAAGAGLAPRVCYTNSVDRISITDFVDTVPFPRAEALRRMALTLRSLHELPPFPRVPDAINTSCLFLLTKGPAVAGFLARVRATGILSNGEADELFERVEQLADACAIQDEDMVSSHNDLFKPDNILFDGNRVWLVDWEAAFLNDRYADLAVVANMLVTNDAEEREFLQGYFGHSPGARQHARLFLMRQLAHAFYTLAFVFAAALGSPAQRSENTPEWAQFQRRFWNGEVRLEDTESKLTYAMVHLQQLLKNVRTPRFQEAISIVTADSTCRAEER